MTEMEKLDEAHQENKLRRLIEAILDEREKPRPKVVPGKVVDFAKPPPGTKAEPRRFKIGHVAMLRSTRDNGCCMTITAIEEDKAFCQWFEEGGIVLHGEWFPLAALTVNTCFTQPE